MTSRLAAVLWDMDGTLIDSEPIWIAQQFVLAERHGGSWSQEQGLALVGSDMHDTAVAMQAAGVDLEETELVATLERAVIDSLRDDVPWRPGARELMAALHAEGVPQAIATTSSHEMAALVAAAAPAGSIGVVVGAEDVTRTKPSPEPYLRAAELLGVAATDCVAVEDSANGLRSAVASGTAALAVPNDAALPEDGDFTTWPTLAGRTVDDLRALLG
ncbi:HAD superfamily hydrolase (TIGR01509 family) [Nocardioides cavernae]|uniref:HAD superfamily hydrolase (TIGR01509 family) n=1 Tax=Nocardioides cavernae TaxID=1921566 RepID=A0A7Y9H2H6_9ACTN|nr:HAD family phosphatase [Nocardioides cavernae]NYE36752.1 HAD superfamily hydrolase (TIGR01509 family) [Nocardioides cavernae]